MGRLKTSKIWPLERWQQQQRPCLPQKNDPDADYPTRSDANCLDKRYHSDADEHHSSFTKDQTLGSKCTGQHHYDWDSRGTSNYATSKWKGKGAHGIICHHSHEPSDDDSGP